MSDRATLKLYDENSYEKEFTATVQSCTVCGDFFKVVLDRTAFFPEAGGQIGDNGFFIVDGKEIEVFDTQIVENVIEHYTKEEIKENTTITGKLDWIPRHTRMQNHTGEHIVSGIINRKYGFDNIGFHLGRDDITCDYNGALTWEQVKEIEVLSNEAVFEGHEITTWYPDPADLSKYEYRAKLDLTEGVRLVKIDGVDLCACCAPHVKNTAEVGLIKIVNIEKSHGGTRLHLRCGRTALTDYDEKQVQVLKVQDLLSARQYEVGDCVEQLQKANKHLEWERARMSEKVALASLQSIEKQNGNLVMELDGADTDALLAFANGGREKVSGLFVALTKSGEGFRYMITSGDSNIKLSQMAKEINAALNGRGGGKDDMIQGMFNTDLDSITKYFS